MQVVCSAASFVAARETFGRAGNEMFDSRFTMRTDCDDGALSGQALRAVKFQKRCEESNRNDHFRRIPKIKWQ